MYDTQSLMLLVCKTQLFGFGKNKLSYSNQRQNRLFIP